MKSKSKCLLVGLGSLLFCFALMLGAMLSGNFMTVYAAEGIMFTVFAAEALHQASIPPAAT